MMTAGRSCSPSPRAPASPILSRRERLAQVRGGTARAPVTSARLEARQGLGGAQELNEGVESGLGEVVLRQVQLRQPRLAQRRQDRRELVGSDAAVAQAKLGDPRGSLHARGQGSSLVSSQRVVGEVDAALGELRDERVDRSELVLTTSGHVRVETLPLLQALTRFLPGLGVPLV
eukprot:767561-Hanusia_phi.AAC.8